MQGTLSEIDIRSILQLIELGQRTGELFVEAYPFQTSFGNASSSLETRADQLQGGHWLVFFLNGEIVYAADTDGSLSRLTDYLRRYGAKAKQDLTVPSIASINAPEYGYLWALLENHTLTPAQGRSIIQIMVHETLFDLLSMHQGSFIFELGSALAPQLMTLEVAPLITKTMKQMQEWKQLHPHIQSPDQCPVIVDSQGLRQSLTRNTLKLLDRYVDGKTSIRQIARYLNRDSLTVGRAVYPYVQRGMIQLTYFPSNRANSGLGGRKTREFDLWEPLKIPRIVCIDDGATVREIVESILHQHGYEAIALENPLKALSLVFQLKPDLILCDIAMPELDGYEICAMLRKSTAFRQIPIVMLTGKDGFIDRVRARMVGATDYLTKPFGASELLMLVENYVGLGRGESAEAAPSAINLLEKELGMDQTDVIS